MAFYGTLKFDTAIDKTGFELGLSSLGSIAEKGMSVLKSAFSTAASAVAELGEFSVNAGENFEISMSQVIATMGITKDTVQDGANSYELLKKAAADAGESTTFSASEAADALNYLALAGYSAAQAADALPSVLDLAAAGGLELSYASDLATDAMSALGIEATNENLTHFGDEMAKTASKANTSVAQLGEDILTVGGTAKSLAGGTTELNSALGVLANRGIKGAEGGTHLRNMILSLSAPADKAKQTFDKLGISALDANGNMRPLNEVFKDFDKALDGMCDGEQYETLSKAKSITTNLIINATTGYVVIRPDEILIMDTDSIETAQKVWRWNSVGLGYSGTGYNGEYGLAMTMNGQIAADFVKAGVLSGVEIQNGNGTFHVTENGKVTARDIEITGGSVNVTTSSESENFIRLNCGSYRSTFNPTGISFADTNTNYSGIVNVGGDISGKAISGTGFTTSGTVYAETLVKTQSVETDRLFANTINFKKDDTYYSLESTINTINSNIQTLWNEVFSS